MRLLQRELLNSAYALVRAELVAVLALMIVAGGILTFVEIADEIGETETAELDRAVLLGLREPANTAQPIGPSWFTRAMVDVTSLGSSAVVTLVTLFTIGYLTVARQRLAALLVAIAVGGAGLATTLLKQLFGRSRPDVVPHLVDVINASFPSGHAMLAAAAYLTIGVLVAQASPRRIGAYVLTAAMIITLAIGFSRVYLGVHWPSDVLAGWCAGAAWALTCWLVTHRLRLRARRPASG